MYLIKKFNEYSNDNWTQVSYAEINNYPWDENNYKPKAKVQLFYTESHIHVRFTATEKEVKVSCLENNRAVFRDSCIEFFIAPSLKDKRYINFEINALGYILLEIGESGAERKSLGNEELSIFHIKSTVTKENLKSFNNYKEWNVEYRIPFEFIKKYYKDFEVKDNLRMRGNFYKCGDETETPHYGCWNLINYHKPSFHRPEFFGDLILE